MMTTFELVNPRKGVKAARIAVREGNSALLVVDIAEDRKTGETFLMSMEMESDFRGLNGAKISYAKKYQSKGKGHEKAKWVESPSLAPAQGKENKIPPNPPLPKGGIVREGSIE